VNESSAKPKARLKTATVKMPPKPQPWWHGLSAETAAELERRGYHSRDTTMLFVTERLRFANRRKRATVYDPLHFVAPWLHNGMPAKMSVEVVNEVRQWLGAKPI